LFLIKLEGSDVKRLLEISQSMGLRLHFTVGFIQTKDKKRGAGERKIMVK